MKTIPDDIDFLSFIGNQEKQFIAPFSAYREEIINTLLGHEKFAGDLLPWSRTHGKFRLRPGEVTIWAGINGHRKSLLVGQVMLWLMAVTKVLIASMEMPIRKTAERLIKQACGHAEPSIQFANSWMDWTDGKAWVYDQMGTIETERIIGLIHYAAKELKCRHIVIDSLMKCGIGKEDYQAQQTFVDSLCWTAKSLDIHIHLVHHMRKGQDENQTPGKFDVRGASEVVDLADNLVILWANKRKEEKSQKGEEVDDTEVDQVMHICKQRHGEWEGKIGLYFNPECAQFGSRPNDVMPWPDPDSRWTMFNEN